MEAVLTDGERMALIRILLMLQLLFGELNRLPPLLPLHRPFDKSANLTRMLSLLKLFFFFPSDSSVGTGRLQRALIDISY